MFDPALNRALPSPCARPTRRSRRFHPGRAPWMRGYWAAMSRENVELAYQAYAAFNRRDIDAFLETMAADVEAFPRQAAMEGVYRGHAGIRRWWAELLDVFPDFAVEVIEVRDLGDMALSAVRFLGHGADSESPFDETVWALGAASDGKTVWWRVYGSEAEALEAADLRAQAARRPLS
jgi:ketosteroid isomerase-like protein